MRAATLAPVACALVLLALAPASAKPEATPVASGEPAATTLHLYIDPLADFPITPQAPPDGFVVNSGLGLASNTFTCAPNPPLARPFGEAHTFRGYAYPEPVEVARGDSVKFHPSRGVDGDVLFSGKPLVLHWYWAMDPAPGVPVGEQVPVVLPNVVVEATLRAGSAVAVDDAVYDEGEVIAHGASAPATLAGPATQGARHTTVEGQSVYEFTVPMQVAAPLVPREQGFNLRVDTYMTDCGDGRAMPHAVALHSSPGHRPRLETEVVSPLSGSLSAQTAADGSLVVVAEPASVLGAGDVANVTVTAVGPDGEVVELERHDVVAQGYGPCGHDCGHRLLFRYVRVLPDAPAGAYEVTMSFTNQQGTAAWNETKQVSVVHEQEAPGLAPAALLAGLLAAAVALRRR
jgi:hypothetical protein